MSTLSEQLRRRVAALRPDWDPTRISGFIHLEGGYSNDNYRFDLEGRRYVLRIPHGSRPFVDRVREQQLYEAGPAARMPGIVAFDSGDGAMISRWVPGRLLADSNPEPAELLGYLRDLHGAMPPLDRSYDPLAQARAHLESVAAPPWLEDLAAGLCWESGHSAPCHNDLNPWNVILTPEGRWVTLDWEWAGRNDPLFDLVTLHQGLHLDDTLLPGMAAGYLGQAPEPGRLYTCLVVFWLRETAWALAEVDAGSRRREVAEQAERGRGRLAELSGNPGRLP